MICNKRIIVTGGNGFLGSHIVELLQADNEVFVPAHVKYDLTDKAAVKQMFMDFGKTDIIIHAAADIGGIGYSSTHPAQQFYRNALINTYVLDQSYKNRVKKFIGIGSVCEYPAETPVPFKEDDLWNGYPVETNDAYGLTKRMLLAQSIAYKKEYDFNAIHLLPVNMYGPRDDFDPINSHVIPALIRKIIDAINNNRNEVEVWGTGQESREFVYVNDVAKAVIMAAENYNEVYPVNIGSGKEIKIFEIADILKKLLGYNGAFRYNCNGLGGQHRRMLDTSKAKDKFGFEASTDFKEGLNNTINYYKETFHTL